MTPVQGYTGPHPVRMAQEPDTRILNNHDAALHSKIIEILASTSNGCLTELGYNPGMTEKLYQYIQHIQTLEGENALLYQDNCQLSSSIQLLKERVTHLSANQSSQLQQFAAVQERLRTLETERNNLVQNNQDILISASNGTSHHLLGMELTRMRTQTSRVLRDMTVLQAKYNRLMIAQHGQRSPSGLSPSDSVPQIAQPIIPTPSEVYQRPSANGASRVQPSRLPLQQVPHQPQHHLQLIQQQQVQRVPLQPQQLQHGQRVHAHRAPSQAEGRLNSYPSQRHLPVASRWTAPSQTLAHPTFGARSPSGDSAPPPISARHLLHNLPLARVSTTTESAPPSPASAPPNPTHQHQLFHTLPLEHVSQPAYRTASAPVLPLTKPHTVPPQFPPSRLTIDLTKEEQIEINVEQPDRSGQLDQPSSLKRSSAAVDGALAQENEVTKRPRTAEPIQTPQEVVADEKPALAEPKPASDMTSPRQVSVSKDEVAIAATPSDTVVGSNPTSPVSAGPELSSPALPAEDKMAGPQSGEDMRSVEECVYMIYEPDAEIPNGFFCGRCLDRYESGMILEFPDVLINPKFEDLFMHCTKEHPPIWEDLRYKRDLEMPSS